MTGQPPSSAGRGITPQAQNFPSERTAHTPVVLVIDDDPLIHELIDFLLSTRYSVLSALDPGEGLRLAAKKHPDAILLDLQMPGANGFEVLEILNRSTDTADIPVVFLTADELAKHQTRALAHGAIGYITKPFNQGELNDKLEAAISQSKTHHASA